MKYKPTLLAALLAAALALGAVGCAKDEPAPAETTDAATTVAPPVTTAAPGTTSAPETTTAASETTAAPAAEQVNVTVSDLADGFTVRTIGLPAGVGHIQAFPYDDTHLLFSLEMGKQLRLALFDTESGTFSAACNLTPEAALTQVHYTHDSLTLFNFTVEGETAVLDEAWTVRYANGTLTAEPSEREVYPYAESRISSPDGRYQVYRVIEDGIGRVGVDLHLPDGAVKRIFTQYAVGDKLPDGSVVSQFGGTAYVPVCFLDNTRLLYRMYGYECQLGFGIYDVTTGENRTFPEQARYGYCGTHDGVIYAAEPGTSTYEYIAYWKITADGQATRIHTIDPNEHYRVCLDSFWMSSVLGGKDLRLFIHTPDLDGTLAEITVDAPMGLWSANYGQTGRDGNCYVHAVDNTLYLFVTGEADAVYAGDPPTAPVTTAPPPVTTAPPETTVLPTPANPAIPTATEVSEGLGISFVGDTYTVRTVPLPGKGSNRSYFGIDERYTLFYTYDPAHGNQNQQLHLFDRKLGMFVSTYDFDETVINTFNATYFRGDLFHITDGEVAYTVDYTSGVLRLAPADVAWTREDCRVTSPDGRYLAYRVTEGRTAEEQVQHLDLRLPDGNTKRLLTGEHGLSYMPVGFLDDTSTYYTYLVYTVSGTNSDHDFGLINVVTGAAAHFGTNQEYHCYGVADGVLYVQKRATRVYGSMSFVGQMTVFGTLPPEDSDKVWSFAGNCWKETFRQSDGTLIVTLNTLDPGDAMLARLEITEERNRDLVWLLGEDCMYIIARGLSATQTPAVEEYNILETADDFAVRTATLPGTGAQYRELELGERYRLFITYDPVPNSTEVTNQELHLFDTETGTFTASCALAETRLLDRLLHDGSTTYLYAQSGAAGEVYRPVAAVTLDYGPGRLTALPALPGQIKPVWETLASPDGKYTVQHTYLGDIDVILPDGTEKRLLSRIDEGEILPNGQIAGMADFISYSPIAFVDNTRLLCSMGGYEWSRGFALIDVATGAITEFPDCAGYSVCGYADGAIYAAQPGETSFSTAAFWKVTLDGTKTCLYTFPEAEQSSHEATLDYRFDGDAWIITRREGYNAEPVTLTAWSRDFTEQLAVAEVSADVYNRVHWCATDDALCLIGRGLPETPAPVETAEHSYNFQYTYRGGEIYDDRTFSVSFRAPIDWTPDAEKLTENGLGRLSLHKTLYYGETHEAFCDELTSYPARYVDQFDLSHPFTGTTDSGMEYVGYRLERVADGQRTHWYIFRFVVGEGYSYRLGVNCAPDTDGDDYFERVLRPVIESVTVTLGEPVRPFGTLHFSHRIFTSATTLRFYIDEADPRYFAVRYYHASSGHDLALDLTIPDGLTYDSARPIYAGGGGGSGECEFIVEFRQGDAVTYVSFNNFAYTDHTNWLNFAARIIDASYVDELRQAMPYLFH